MDKIKLLKRLTRALDSYSKDPNPNNWRTIRGSHVHLDKNGNFDGGAGGKFIGRHYYGKNYKQVTGLMNQLTGALGGAPEQKKKATQTKPHVVKPPVNPTVKPKPAPLTHKSASSKGAWKIAEKVPELHDFKKYSERMTDSLRKDMKVSPEDEKEIKAGVSQLFKHSDFALRADLGVLPLIIDGGFKNSIETGSRSDADPGAVIRRKADKNLYGTDCKNPADHAKYGYATSPGKYNDGGMLYGDVQFRFKKDRLSGRVTYTLGDSFDEGYTGEFGSDLAVPGVGFVDDPGLLGLQRFIKSSEDVKIIKQAIKESKSFDDLFDRIDDTHHFDFYGAEYMELQYHGKLTMDDVESITLDKKHIGNGWEKIKPSLEKMRARGIKIYYANGGKMVEATDI